MPDRLALWVEVMLEVGGNCAAGRTSPPALDYSNRCSGPSDHAALKAELEAALARDPSPPSLSATCPLCGCPVVVTR